METTSLKHIFDKHDLIVEWEKEVSTRYTIQIGGLKNRVHWGQRKLGLALIQFLTYYWDPEKIPHPQIVYAGAAPGKNILLAMALFPGCQWHLYDPSPIKIQPREDVHIYQQLFLDEDARRWSGRNDVFFLSDIRSIGRENVLPHDYEAGIWKDMINQQNWVKMIKPVKAQLKFRLPYAGRGFPNQLNYLNGVLYHGIWAPQSSTESRLVPNDDLQETTWLIDQYENLSFYFNNQTRETFRYQNPFYTLNDYRAYSPIHPPDLTNDYDSRAETQVWINYLNKFTTNGPKMESVISLVDSLTSVINKDIPRDQWTTLGKLRLEEKEEELD